MMVGKYEENEDRIELIERLHWEEAYTEEILSRKRNKMKQMWKTQSEKNK